MEGAVIEMSHDPKPLKNIPIYGDYYALFNPNAQAGKSVGDTGYKTIGAGRFIFSLNDGSFTRPHEPHILENWISTEYSIGNHFYLHLERHGEPKTAFALVFCPIRASVDEDFGKFLDGLLDDVQRKGTVMMATINSESNEVDEVVGIGQDDKDHIIPFLVMSKEAARIAYAPVEEGGAGRESSADNDEVRARRYKMISEKNPAQFVGVSAFQYLLPTLSVSSYKGTIPWSEVRESAKLCPVCKRALQERKTALKNEKNKGGGEVGK